MADSYHVHPAGYDPTDDQIPPPKESPAGLIGCGCIGVVVVLVAALGIVGFTNHQNAQNLHATETVIALTPTSTLTVDAWAATGTAIFWWTYTPTPTPEATEESTAEVTPESTAEMITLAWDVFATATALYLDMHSPTPESTGEPTAPGSLYYSGNSGGQLAPTNPPQQVIVTREVVITRPPRIDVEEVTRVIEIVVPIVVTATRTPVKPESTQEATLPPTWTNTATATPTPSETASETPTATFTATFTATPTGNAHSDHHALRNGHDRNHGGIMSAIPMDQNAFGAPPDPMAPLTNRVITPENIAKDARLNRAKPLGRWGLWKLGRQLARLQKQLETTPAPTPEEIAHFQELRDGLRVLLDYKFELAQKRQLQPGDIHLARQWEQLYEQAVPMEREYKARRGALKAYETLKEQIQTIQLRIDENPDVLLKAKENQRTLQIQTKEARAYEQLLRDRATQLGYCHRWKDSKGNWRLDQIKFSEAHISVDAIYFKVSASYRTMFGFYRTKIPYGVKVLDLIKEETLIEFSYACQRQVTAKATSTGGAWIVVHRLDTNDGLVSRAAYTKVMSEYPRKDHRLVPLCVGVTYGLHVAWLNLAQYPHMMIAGFTGSGKSNYVNSLICTLISLHSPEDVRLILVDLKDGIEFSSYARVPHLHGEMVDTVSKLADRLEELEAVMTDRNRMMRGKAKSLGEYKAKYPEEKVPRLVVIIDEVASIIGQGESTKRVNHSLRQLTAKGRAAGIHIILSTQRPSVDVIDGGVKVNLAARLVGRMPSHVDSLTVLGTGDAKDISNVPGRMILQVGPDPIPVQTPMIDEADILEALARAMEYPKPDPLPVPEDLSLSEIWTPEKIVELSLNFLGGNISHIAVWNEIKDEGRLTYKQTRDLVEKIWGMDCIPFAGKQYKVQRGKGKVKTLVEIVDSVNSMTKAHSLGNELTTNQAIESIQ
jgi:hypothetical protein